MEAGYELHREHFTDGMEMSWDRHWQIFSRTSMVHVGVLENGQAGLTAAM